MVVARACREVGRTGVIILTAFIYLKPSTASSLAQENVASVFYTAVIPMLNPLIYSLRNKDVKAAMQKTLRGKCFKANVITLS